MTCTRVLDTLPYLHTCMHVHTQHNITITYSLYIRMRMHTHTHIHVLMHTHVHTYTHTHTHTRAHIHTHTHTHTHTCTHTHTYTSDHRCNRGSCSKTAGTGWLAPHSTYGCQHFHAFSISAQNNLHSQKIRAASHLMTSTVYTQ